MSEVIHLIRHVLEKPVHERTAQMKNVLARQTWAHVGGWQLMTAGSGWRFETVIETSTGQNDSPKLRAPIYITPTTDIQCIYWRPRMSGLP